MEMRYALGVRLNEEEDQKTRYLEGEGWTAGLWDSR